MKCPHHWTVTSECPKCLRAQIDLAEEQWDALRDEIAARIEHLWAYLGSKPQRDELADILTVMRRIREGKRGEELRA